MKRTLIVLLTSALLAAPLVMVTATPASAMPDGTTRQSFSILPDYSGHDIFDGAASDYRTSPSVFLDSTSAKFVQFSCAPDVPPFFQQIRYATSVDGVTWAPETAALRPTPSSPDGNGVCDPSVVRTGAYYYLAYSGFDGKRHAVFLARTTSLSQPWQKWNGQGWGGPQQPAPIIAPTSVGFGVGQPSLVVMRDAMSVYYEYHDGRNWQTRLVTAPLRADNVQTWPAQLTGGGTVLVHPGRDSNVCTGSFYDSTDVAYHDVQNKFVALTTDAHDLAGSSLRAYESATGSRFTRALSLSRFSGESTIKDHAHNVAWVRSVTGHVGATVPAAIVYGYGTTDCPAKLRWQGVVTDSAATGWIDEPLSQTSGTAHWAMLSGTWGFDGDGRLLASATLGPAHALLLTNVASDTATIDLDYEQGLGPISYWTSVSFGAPTNSCDCGGFHLYMYTTGRVTLVRGDSDDVVATGQTSASAQLITNHLQVVISQNTVTVYNGVGHDALSSPVLQYSSPTNLFLAGYVGLASQGTSHFANLTVSDNVPPNYRNQDTNILDWKQSTGDWIVRSPSSIESHIVGGNQLFLQGTAAPVSNYNAHFSDGTYTATVQLNPGSPATSWGGLNLVNGAAQAYLSWSTGGYLVFIRANGNVGLFKGGGSGQVVPDIPTGLNPIAAPVKIRVVKVGASLQVYLNDNTLPTINYTDPATAFVTGGFGLATEQTAGMFTKVAYAANFGV